MESTAGKACPAIERYDLTEEYLWSNKACLLLQLVEQLFHLIKQFGTTKLGDNEIIGKKGVPERLLGVMVRIRVSKEFKSKSRILLQT